MALRAVACVVVVAIAASACGGATKRTATTSSPPEPRLTPTLAKALDAELREGFANEAIAGVSAAIVFPDGREWSSADGLAVEATKQPMTPRTSMPLDGVTTTATAALVLRYAEEGRLRLDDPIKRWYPAWDGDPQATVRDLLGHRAGTRDIRGPLLSRAWHATCARGVAAPGHRSHAASGSPHGRGGVLQHRLSHRRADPPAGGPADGGRGRCAASCSTHPGGAGLAFQPTELSHPPRAHSY